MKRVIAFAQSLRAPARLLLQLAAALFAAALAARILLSHALEPDWTLPMRGLIGDLFFSVLLACCLLLLACWRRVAAGLVVVWAGFTIANNEHLYAFDAPLRLENAGFAMDAGFVFGTLANLVTWPLALLTIAVAAYLCRRVLQFDGVNMAALGLAVALALGSGAWVRHDVRTAAGWREANALALVFAPRAALPAGAGAAAGTDVFFADELSLAAAADFAARPEKPNVLMVFVEGLPGVYLRQVRQATGVRAAVEMPNFSRIAEDAHVVPHFVASTAGTIGGLYTTLCGDYSFSENSALIKPFILTSLPTEARPRCLPAILREQGYHTAFLQAADLDYMKKKDVMPALGFAELIGKQEGDSDSGNFWGADDGTLLQRAVEKIDELRAGGAPWFLSLLTVGTHHPYSAPPEYRERYGSAKEAAVRHLDDALAGFAEALDARGVPDDTLIVFVSDESHGVPGHPFGENWGLFAAMGPGLDAGVAEGIFAQIDVRASVLDYLGLADAARRRIGRSVFRDYARPRALLFGDYLLDGGVVSRCTDGACRQYPIAGGKLFAPSYRTTSDDGGGVELYLNAFARANDFYGAGARRSQLLVQEQEWSGARASIAQNIVLPARSRVELIVDIESIAETPALAPTPKIEWIDGSADGRLEAGALSFQLPPLLPQSRMELHYLFFNETLREGRFVFSAFARRDGINGIRINKVQLLSSPADAAAGQDVAQLRLDWPPALDEELTRLFPLYVTDDSNRRHVDAAEVAPDRYAWAPVYRLSQPLVFDDAREWSSLFYLAGDWDYPASDGARSDGMTPMLAFKLPAIDAAKKHEVDIRFVPLLPPPVTERKLSFHLNGHLLGAQTFTSAQFQQGRVSVDGDKLKSNAINTFKILVHEPVMPAIYQQKNDRRQPGLKLLSFRLGEAGAAGE